jgi:hypothetical protein
MTDALDLGALNALLLQLGEPLSSSFLSFFVAIQDCVKFYIECFIHEYLICSSIYCPLFCPYACSWIYSILIRQSWTLSPSYSIAWRLRTILRCALKDFLYLHPFELAFDLIFLFLMILSLFGASWCYFQIKVQIITIFKRV